ncbi:MAG TPA: hypothetical protein VN960_00275 [Gaiellaceae bacterium]|nr:hypothetical protein [Gaiellaceae bacterium]
MQSSSQRRLRPAGRATADTRSRLLKNGAAAHAFTREDRAKGGRNRAKKIRRRKELREQFEAADFEDLAVAELDLFGRAFVRLNLLLASADDRVALRACTEIFDRVLGKPRQQQEFGGSREPRLDMEAALAEAHQKLGVRLERHAARSGAPG